MEGEWCVPRAPDAAARAAAETASGDSAATPESVLTSDSDLRDVVPPPVVRYPF